MTTNIGRLGALSLGRLAFVARSASGGGTYDIRRRRRLFGISSRFDDLQRVHQFVRDHYDFSGTTQVCRPRPTEARTSDGAPAGRAHRQSAGGRDPSTARSPRWPRDHQDRNVTSMVSAL